MTASRLRTLTASSAILAGLLFIVIQPLHPPHTLESVATNAWAVIHYLSFVMVMLFIGGITGIYASQVERMGWLGLTGYLVLVVGLVLTAGGDAIEAVVQPVIVSRDPAFVQGMLNMVDGLPNTGGDLGVIPMLWNVASACFLGGTLLFGFANFRAGILSRWASAIFAVGLLLMAPVVGLLGAPRLAAVPIGVGLAWLGYSLLRGGRARVTAATPMGAMQPGERGLV
jgi:hypothetical protein